MNSDSVIGILSWWDGVELWLSGRGFILQTIIVMPVVLALAYVMAVAGDRILFLLFSTANRVVRWYQVARRHPAENPVAVVAPGDLS
ncbi:hypothetical protein [Mycobacteroides immunogenum]|uniref:Uncharacterized protein n=1 Tax=Mycobacteroides immunogenum TaxID=83262 RepID=A0A7V8LRG7_9MYCO|nr:hypothetical protein [Mycobacteroides immunogenum]AMT70425.1 hypothetical protein ABG82_08880 [Mycobacteroides immunogenum]ANO03493.1 hypothetical protein BAB75_08940 [Mycobacteroides immunogenum]KIU42043.1 hypothetical protein TL11_02710 [Mycobacteroides immunogenum]KPG13513.1 hypothetical protein AN909_04210 [Mycobacteroides immunogenum]KPG14568.1 hypothetical protein AN908_08655 [Mycobacteroides immunogenum]